MIPDKGGHITLVPR